jgi:hypothetical protein
VVIDDKGGEVIHKDRGREMTKERNQFKLKFEHTSRGSKLINLYVALDVHFICMLAWHKF